MLELQPSQGVVLDTSQETEKWVTECMGCRLIREFPERGVEGWLG